MKIAIIGATPNRERYANKAIRAYKEKGYVVEAVNPKYEEIEGIRTISLTHITSELISIYLRPDIFKYQINAIPKTVKKAYLNPGTESDEVIKMLNERGIETIVACSILAIKKDPEKL